MRVEHLAIDGSTVAFEADADLSSRATAAGWAVVPALLQAHPFTATPAGHSRAIEEAVRAQAGQVEILEVQELSLKGGTLRVAEVRQPTATRGVRELTGAAWEGSTGCLITSINGRQARRMAEIYDTLPFRELRNGIAIDSQVLSTPRAPELIKEIPELGILSVRPALATELEAVPKALGFATDGGELFRLRESSHALLFVTRSTVVRINPTSRNAPERMLDTARKLRIEWAPRARAAAR